MYNQVPGGDKRTAPTLRQETRSLSESGAATDFHSGHQALNPVVMEAEKTERGAIGLILFYFYFWKQLRAAETRRENRLRRLKERLKEWE